MSADILKKITGNSIFRMIGSLALVGCVSGVTLVLVYGYAMPRIQKNIKAETEKAIKAIFPEAGAVDNTEHDKVFKVRDIRGELTGYAFQAEGNGYQGVIKLIVGVDAHFSEVKGLEVLESQETPGLGAEITSPSFKSQFSGLSLAHPIEYIKNQKPTKPYQIEAITGATISSRAVVNIVNKKVEELRKTIKR